jgi:hypothetical protein
MNHSWLNSVSYNTWSTSTSFNRGVDQVGNLKYIKSSERINVIAMKAGYHFLVKNNDLTISIS